MFKSLKSFFVAPCCLFALIGCGKKVTQNPSSADTGDGSQVVILPGESGIEFLALDFNPSQQSQMTTQVQAQGNGWARIPDAPTISAGNALVVGTRVYFNTFENLNSAQYRQFYCDYQSIKMINPKPDTPINDTYNHYFKGCFEDVDDDGVMDELNFIPGDDAIDLQKDRYITLRVTADDNADSLSLRSEIEIDYL